ncbi:hypothetical protein C2E23DRAFT_754614 [Lenzites betulinus]|nr:hypothetical protein C2E23DRAFT_754614 [Lenzites betulinus]
MNVGKCASAVSRAVRCVASTSKHARTWNQRSSIYFSPRSLSTITRDAPPHTSTRDSRSPLSTPSSSRTLREQKISTPPPPNEQKSTREGRKPRNEEIQHNFVRLVNPETGVLEPPAPLRQTLSRFNLKTHFLELVTNEPEPIVKVHDRKLVYDRERTKKRVQASKKPTEEKEVQLTWYVGTADMEFKLRKVRAELEEGNRVNLIFAAKRGQPLPPPEQQEKIVEQALSLLADVGKESKERAVQKQAVGLFLEALRRKRTVELKWIYNEGDSWEGLKSVESALRGGERVEIVFILPPPSKKEKHKKSSDDANAATAVDSTIAQERVERTLQALAEFGKETKPRDVRKGIVTAHLEGILPEPSESP